MHSATRSPITRPAVARRVAVVTLIVMTADQIAKSLAFGLTGVGRSDALSHTNGLGVADGPLPMVALLAAIGIATVGFVGLRRAQAGLLPAWVPGFLIGGAASTVLDRFGGGALADLLGTAWAVCTLADLAIVAGTAGWIVADHGRGAFTRSTARDELHV